MTQTLQLSKNEKILLTLHKLSGNSKKSVRYEDIVVALFKDFPKDFHLRGYEEFPDSGDHIHKPLYEFRKKGFLNAGNKMFSITDLGIEMTKRMQSALEDKEIEKSSGRLPHFVTRELTRINKLESFNMFAKGKNDNILDTDFYDYLDITVRSERNGVKNRIATMNEVAKELKKTDKEKYSPIILFNQFMMNKFQDIVQYMSKRQ